MGESETNDNDRVLIAPDAFQRRRSFPCRRIPSCDGQQPKFTEQNLQKRKLHLQAVLVRMRRVRCYDMRDAQKVAACGVVYWDGAQRCFEGFGPRYREAIEGQKMARTDQ